MESRIDFITIATPDLDAARGFYVTGLGWTPTLDVPGEILFFQVGHGTMLGLYDAAAFRADVGPPADAGLSNSGTVLSHNVDSPAAVDRARRCRGATGATVVKPPQRAAFGGYHGHVADPNGVIWEIAHNPGWRVDPDGTVRLDADAPARRETPAPRDREGPGVHGCGRAASGRPYAGQRAAGPAAGCSPQLPTRRRLKVLPPLPSEDATTPTERSALTNSRCSLGTRSRYSFSTRSRFTYAATCSLPAPGTASWKPSSCAERALGLQGAEVVRAGGEVERVAVGRVHQGQRGPLVAGQLLELADDLLGLGRVGRDLQPDLGRREPPRSCSGSASSSRLPSSVCRSCGRLRPSCFSTPSIWSLTCGPMPSAPLHDLVPGGADGVTGVGHRQGHRGVGRQLGQRGRLGARHRGALGAATDAGQLQVGGVEAERERHPARLVEGVLHRGRGALARLGLRQLHDLGRVGPPRQDALLPQRLHVLDVRRVRGQRALVEGGVEIGALALLGQQRVAVAEGDVGVPSGPVLRDISLLSPALAFSSSLTWTATATLTSPGSSDGSTATPNRSPSHGLTSLS